MKKPEILLITRPLTPPWDEASKNFAYELAQGISEFKFHILTGKPAKNLKENITGHEIYRGAEWNALQKVKLVLKLRGIIKKNPKINIIHFLFTPTRISSGLFKKTISGFEGRTMHTVPCIPEKEADLESIVISDQIIAYTEFTADKFKGEKPVSVIPPFINFEQFPVMSGEVRKRIRGKWGIKSYEKVILYPGEYGRLKAVSTLWEGFVKILKDQPNSYLFVACRPKTKVEKKEEEKFSNQVHKEGLASKVRFLGTVSDMASLYSACDLTVFPVSSMKGKFDFPFVLLESLSCGTPIITSDIEPLPEIWKGSGEYRKQFTFKAGEVRDFVKKSLEILEGKREDYTDELSHYVRKRFDRREVLKKYQEIYSNLLKKKNEGN